MALLIWFVDSKSEIREGFVGFFECNKGMNGKPFLKKILEKLSLDMRFCRGRGMKGPAIWQANVLGQLPEFNAGIRTHYMFIVVPIF